MNRRSIVWMVLVTLAVACLGAGTPPARADVLSCAHAVTGPSAGGPEQPTNNPSAPTPGTPCWTDVTPYPFGSDGNPVDPESALCVGGGSYGPLNFGPTWLGDYNATPSATSSEPPCYLQVESMAFRSWNRGLAALGPPSSATSTVNTNVAYGVWLYNGDRWYPDPSFPGDSACPGSTILWAGKLDYWLVGSAASPETTLCRFDGVNLDWEPMSLPAATLARLPLDPATGKVVAGLGITSGTCYAWNNCWFFGNDGIEVHWDGQSLTDASSGVGASPWLDGDFTAAVGGTDASGLLFGLAVTASSYSTYSCDFATIEAGGACPGSASTTALQPAPDGSPPAQVFASDGGGWDPAPAPYAPPPDTDLTLVSANASGDAWSAGDPDDSGVPFGDSGASAPAPLEPLSETGAPGSCSGPGAAAFSFTALKESPGLAAFAPGDQGLGYAWRSLSTFPDGSGLAGAFYVGDQRWTESFPGPAETLADDEPVLVRVACGQQPTITEFRRPDPFDADQASAPQIPADANGWITAVSADASNDAWAATSAGSWDYTNTVVDIATTLAPQLYQWTDGLPPDAPAGNDEESRPSLFTLGPPVYDVGSPTVVVTPVTVTTTSHTGTVKQVKLRPAIYAMRSRLVHGAHGSFTLYLTFKVRRAVTVGLHALRGRKVVATSGLKHFAGHSGTLSVELNRARWPTRLTLVTPSRGSGK